MTTRSRRTFRLAALLAVLAAAAPCAPLAAQPRLPEALRYPFIFDDFTYAVPVDYAEPGGYGTGGSFGSLLGANDWLVADEPARGTVRRAPEPTRAWYAYLWREDGNWRFPEDSAPVSTRTTDPPGHFSARVDAGARLDGSVSPEITSGFVAHEGTWMLKAYLSPFPSFDNAAVTQGFFLQSAGHATDVRQEQRLGFDGKPVWAVGGQSWFEVNFEVWNQPFGQSTCTAEADPSCPISSGYSWNHRTYRGHNPVLRADAADTHGGCRVGTDAGEVDVLPQPACRALLTNAAPGREGKPLLPAYLFLRITDTHTYQRIHVIDEEDVAAGFAWMTMETFGHEHVAPPHPMRTMLGLEVTPKAGALERTLETRFDWFFYTPRTDLDAETVRDHAARLQAYLQRANVLDRGTPTPHPIGRINTTSLPLAYPHAPNARTDDGCYDGAMAWLPSHPSAPFDFELRGPYPNRTNGRLYFDVVPVASPGTALRHTRYRIRWQVDETYRRDGRTVTRRIADVRDRGFDFAYPGPPAGAALVQLRFTITAADVEWPAGCPRIEPSARTRTFDYVPGRPVR